MSDRGGDESTERGFCGHDLAVERAQILTREVSNCLAFGQPAEAADRGAFDGTEKGRQPLVSKVVLEAIDRDDRGGSAVVRRLLTLLGGRQESDASCAISSLLFRGS